MFLLFFSFLSFRLHWAACGILVPPAGIELMSPAVEHRVLTSGPLGKSPLFNFKNSMTFFVKENSGNTERLENKVSIVHDPAVEQRSFSSS